MLSLKWNVSKIKVDEFIILQQKMRKNPSMLKTGLKDSRGATRIRLKVIFLVKIAK